MEAMEKIISELGFEPPRMAGPFMAIQLYIQEQVGEGEIKLVISEKTKEAERYRTCTGKVIAMGPECYVGERFVSGPRCKLGDWVCIPPNEGPRVNYRGTTLQFIYDDRIYCTLEDPSFVTRC
jgi:co-chaperonin GroES (HSP10)